MKRFLFAFVSAALAACGGNKIGNDTSGGNGGGTSGGAAPTSCSFTTPPYACPANAQASAGQVYPIGTCGTNRGGIFPDLLLGQGYWNSSTTPTSDIGLTADQQMAFHLLYCSGFKYALIDVSAVWCPHCNQEAAELPGWVSGTQNYAYDPNGGGPGSPTGWVVKWLPEGGIVFSLLEQGQDPSQAATPADLSAWITKYNVNYPMAIDPQENVATALNLQAWPANIILDLSDMHVVQAVFGATDQFLVNFDNLLTSGG